jgi:hypothetical protein
MLNKELQVLVCSDEVNLLDENMNVVKGGKRFY